MDCYFSADVETDGPIPGPFSMLSIALVQAGRFDGKVFERAHDPRDSFYAELQPISEQFEADALAVNGLDRARLVLEGRTPRDAMTAAAAWVRARAGGARPVLVAYPLSFDWTWMYWYFVQFSSTGSPFNHSSCYDIKTAYAVKAGIPIAQAGRAQLEEHLRSTRSHSHHALDDALEQAEIFAKVFEWGAGNGGRDD